MPQLSELVENEAHCKQVYESLTGGEFQYIVKAPKVIKLFGFESSGNSELLIYPDGDMMYLRKGAYQLLPCSPFYIVKVFTDLGYQPCQ